MKAILIILLLSSCSTAKINGHKVKPKDQAKISKADHSLYTVISFLSFGIATHFLPLKRIK